MTTTTLPTEAGRRADTPRLGTRYLLEGAAFAVLEHDIPPRTLAAPTHTHRHEDEWSYVLAGRVGAHVGATELEAGPGELIAKPRGVPHGFWNAGDESARLLEIIAPGGFAEYFAELAPLLSVAGPPDFAALGALQARYGIEMDLDSVGALCARHGLEG